MQSQTFPPLSMDGFHQFEQVGMRSLGPNCNHLCANVFDEACLRTWSGGDCAVAKLNDRTVEESRDQPRFVE
jgi:hypothetical protein